MKILYLAHRIPFPPNKGDKIRSYHQIRYLSQRHTTHLACFVDREEDRAHVDHLRKLCTTVDAVFRPSAPSFARGAWSALSGASFTRGYFGSAQMRRRLRRRIRETPMDCVLAFSSSMAQYVRPYPDLPRIVDLVDVDSEKWGDYARYRRFPASVLYRLEGRRLRREERAMLTSFDRSIVVSEEEAALCRALQPGARVTVMSNGVDTDYFRPAPAPPDPRHLVFLGAMDYFPNVDGVTYFCRAILPVIHAAMPHAVFTIVGSRPTAAVRALARQHGVVVTSDVPDVRPYLSRASVCVVPLRIARGIQNKILEAMATGTPVVTTPEAFRGIEAEPGRDLFVESLPSEFASRVLALMADRALRMTVSDSARRAVERRYRWESCLGPLDDLLAAAVADRSVACRDTLSGSRAGGT